jgi:hypothetical protein
MGLSSRCCAAMTAVAIALGRQHLTLPSATVSADYFGIHLDACAGSMLASMVPNGTPSMHQRREGVASSQRRLLRMMLGINVAPHEARSQESIAQSNVPAPVLSSSGQHHHPVTANVVTLRRLQPSQSPVLQQTYDHLGARQSMKAPEQSLCPPARRLLGSVFRAQPVGNGAAVMFDDWYWERTMLYRCEAELKGSPVGKRKLASV